MTKELDKKQDIDCILTDDEGKPIALVENACISSIGAEALAELYPGQPEREDTIDETIPSGAEQSDHRAAQDQKGHKDSDNEAGAGYSKEEEKTVYIPKFITAREYILKRYRLMLYSHMNSLLRTGYLTGIVGFHFQNKIMNRHTMKIGYMSFWRIDPSNFYTDVSIRLFLDAAKGKKEWQGTIVLWCSFDGDDLECSVEEVFRGRRQDNDGMIALSPYLVPYLRNREVDQVAEKILEKYLPEAIDDPMSRNPVKLAERMGLKVLYLPVDDHKGIPSMLVWEAGELAIRDKWRVGQREPDMVPISKNTIVVNINEIRQEYSDYSIYHECMHHPLHYMAYRLQKLASNDDKHITYIKVKQEEGKAVVNPVYFMEKQANRGAYGLMMPESTTSRMIMEECRKVGECRHAGEKYDIAGKRMAWELKLPNFRVRTRMIQLGHIQAKGAMNYADKRPIQPFAFEPEAWRDDQHTFVIDRATTDYLQTCNNDFNKLMTSGRYIYADGHVVRNTPRYVYRDNDRLLLTDWANGHVDECCLRFVRQYVQRSNGKYAFGRIYYDADYINQTKFYLEDLMNAEELDEIDAKYEYRRNFPRTFKDAVKQLRKKKKISLEKLAEILQVSDKTLSRWLEEPEKHGGVDLVAALALALQLPDWITAMLFKRAHIQLDEDDRRHQAIQHILRVQSNDGIEAANKFLKEKNLEPIRL